MRTHDRYQDGRLRERADDTTRIVTTYDAAGEVEATRPYTAEENDRADRGLVTEAILELDRALGLLVPAELAAVQALVIPPDGSPWVQPTGATDAYPLPSTVTHRGKTWENLTPANVWEPGVTGWREVTGPGEGLPAWVQPLGSEDAYEEGARVSHLGHDWTSLLPANVWEPGVYGWNDDGPSPGDGGEPVEPPLD